MEHGEKTTTGGWKMIAHGSRIFSISADQQKYQVSLYFTWRGWGTDAISILSYYWL